MTTVPPPGMSPAGPLPKKSRAPWIVAGALIAVGFIALILVGLLYHPGDGKDPALRERDAEPVAIGESVVDETMAFKVTKVQCDVPSIDFGNYPYAGTPDTSLCAIVLEVTNRDSKKASLPPTGILLVTDDKEEQLPLSQGRDTDHMGPSFDPYNKISAGTTVAGVVVYEISRNQRPLALKLNDQGVITKGVTVNLQ